MKNKIAGFTFTLFIVLFVLFLLHTSINYIISQEAFRHFIIATYTVNFVLGVIVYSGIYLLRNKFSDQAGYLFLLGTLLKFIVAYAIFHPLYLSDGHISRSEMATIFLPYSSTLIVVTYSIFTLLKKPE